MSALEAAKPNLRKETKMHSPRLSVLMAVRNAESHLDEAVQSILSQSFRNFEFVIIDDGSSDGTSEILSRFSSCDNRIRVEQVASTGSLPAALNYGLGLCRGELIARMDGDDIALPKRFELQVKKMDDCSDLGLLGCASIDIDDDGRTIGKTNHPSSHDAIRLTLPFRSCFIHPAVVLRRQAIDVAGGYDEAFWTGQDYELWSRMIKVCRVGNLEDPLMKRRVHSNSITSSAERNRVHDGLLAPVRQRMVNELLNLDLTKKETETLRHAVQSDGIADIWDLIAIIPCVREYGLKLDTILSPKDARKIRADVSRALFSQIVFNRRTPEIRKKLELFSEAIGFGPRAIFSGECFRATASIMIS